MISLWHTSRDVVEKFIEQTNKHHPTIKFTAEISCTYATFSDTIISKGQRFNKESVLDMRTHFKPTETFQYTFFTTCHPPGAKKGFVKGEALRLLRTNSSNKTFAQNITTFKNHLMEKGYPQNLINNTLTEVKFQERTQALLQRSKTKNAILFFVTQFHQAVPSLKEILTRKWYLIQQQPLLNQIFKESPIVSYRKGRSLKDIPVRVKL